MSLPDSVKDFLYGLGILALGLGSYYFLIWLACHLAEITYG